MMENASRINLILILRYFSIKTGESLIVAKAENVVPESLCEYSLYDKVNEKCDRKTTTDKIDSSSKLVKCDYSMGQMCNYTYTVSITTFNEDCQCGYNPSGNSYCPKPQNGNWDI